MSWMIRRWLLVLVSCFVIMIIGLLFIYLVYPARVERWGYDRTHIQKSVNTYDDAMHVLSSYPKLLLKELPYEIRSSAGLRESQHGGRFDKLVFYKVPVGDLYKKLYFHQRIIEFQSLHYSERFTWLSDRSSYYICLDQPILKALFDLSDRMEEKGLNARGVRVFSGYRSPSRNDVVGGARNSMHLYGNALDIRVGDVDRDGRIDAEDKQKVYQILDLELIGNKGGLGFYPGAKVLHMDLRGSRARWDSYKR